jgi:hypothetical protein
MKTLVVVVALLCVALPSDAVECHWAQDCDVEQNCYPVWECLPECDVAEFGQFEVATFEDGSEISRAQEISECGTVLSCVRSLYCELMGSCQALVPFYDDSVLPCQ